jgi:hypothetical protein
MVAVGSELESVHTTPAHQLVRVVVIEGAVVVQYLDDVSAQLLAMRVVWKW